MAGHHAFSSNTNLQAFGEVILPKHLATLLRPFEQAIQRDAELDVQEVAYEFAMVVFGEMAYDVSRTYRRIPLILNPASSPILLARRPRSQSLLNVPVLSPKTASQTPCTALRKSFYHTAGASRRTSRMSRHSANALYSR